MKLEEEEEGELEHVQERVEQQGGMTGMPGSGKSQLLSVVPAVQPDIPCQIAFLGGGGGVSTFL